MANTIRVDETHDGVYVTQGGSGDGVQISIKDADLMDAVEEIRTKGQVSDAVRTIPIPEDEQEKIIAALHRRYQNSTRDYRHEP